MDKLSIKEYEDFFRDDKWYKYPLRVATSQRPSLNRVKASAFRRWPVTLVQTTR